MMGTYESSAHHVSKIYTVKNVDGIHDSMTTYRAITFGFLFVTPAAVLCGLGTVGGSPLSTSPPPLSNAIINITTISSHRTMNLSNTMHTKYPRSSPYVS